MKYKLATSLIACTSALLATDQQKPCAPRCPIPNCINPSARPKVMDQNCAWFITVDALAWKATEDGLAYAIENENIPAAAGPVANASNFYNSEVKNPHFELRWGFKVGLGYVFEHDGWDIYANWTHFQTKGKSDEEADDGTSETLFPLWSAFNISGGPVQNLTCTDIEAEMHLRLNMVDLELGREFYTSKWLTLRPHIGLRGAAIHHDYEIEMRGGSFGTETAEEIKMKNHFKAVGVRAGLDSNWMLGCGWGLYGNLALSLLYGKFDIDQDEVIGEEDIPITTGGLSNRILDVDDDFRASRAVADLGLGIFYEDICGKTYVRVSLGWESHIFFNYNQFTRFNTISSAAPKYTSYVPEDGDLTTQGLTLGLRFEF